MRDRLVKMLNAKQDYGVRCFYNENGQVISKISNEYLTDSLLTEGVIALDTEKVNVAMNLNPIATAFGMPLDELAELIRAKEEGRLIVTPCKVGEVVWLNTKFGTLKARVTGITQTANNNFLVHIVYDLMYCYKQHINTRGYVGYVEDKFEFGKTAYHSKEEAEQALKGGAE